MTQSRRGLGRRSGDSGFDGGSAAGSRLRAFVALEVDDAIRTRLAAAIESLRPVFPGLRWVSPAQVHLTLRFLGHAHPPALEALHGSLAEAAAACPPASLPVSGLGVFPAGARARVLWVGIGLSEAIVDLQASCEAAASGAGFEPERRPFSPHLTLGRWREPARRPELPALDLGQARVERLVLFRSQMHPEGAVYTPLASFPLGPHSVG